MKVLDVVPLVALLLAGCGNAPTPADTEVAKIDTAAAIKKRYSGKLQNEKPHSVEFEGCKFGGTDAPEPARFEATFKTVSNDKKDEHFVRDVVIKVKDAKGWTISGMGQESFMMQGKEGESDFFQQVTTRIKCVQKRLIGGTDVEGPVSIKADGTAEMF